MPEITGLYLVDKPSGPSSFAVLRGLRPALGRKLGHAGTLDPFATGLLLVVAGRATRLATYLSGVDKGYAAVVQFGAVSTTLDPEGEITPAGPAIDAGAVTAAA
ncbi:MAG: tRNA pseudouridine(55) synthase TruB, partial [Gaiellales bacterium]